MHKMLFFIRTENESIVIVFSVDLLFHFEDYELHG